MSQRTWFFIRLLGACFVLSASAAAAQSYPSQPIRLVVPFPAGGALDVLGRAAAVQVALQIAQPVVVDNRPGANGIIGTEIVVSAAPTGYTILNNGAALVINHASHRKLSYELGKHLAPVTSIGRGTGYLVLLNAANPARSVKDLMAAARSDKEPTRYGSAGVANPMHLAAAMLTGRMGIEASHVPYKGVAPAITALLGGEVQLVLSPPALALPHVNSGRLRALAFTGAARWPALPDVPTVSESGVPSFSFSGGFVGWHVPAGTPPAVIARLQGEVRKALQVPKLREYVEANGYTPGGESPAEFGAFINSELARYREAVKAAKLELH